jgi:hypothetical protein
MLLLILQLILTPTSSLQFRPRLAEGQGPASPSPKAG